jgi:3-oxoacyl-[acyl-carrier-protein] synthase II
MTAPAEREVVVTGVGLVTPLGVGAAETWAALCAGRSAVRSVENFNASACPCRVAAEMPLAFDAAIVGLYAKRFHRFTKRYARYALAATTLALDDAGLGRTRFAGERAAIFLGTGTSGYDNDRTAADDGTEIPGVWDVLKRMPCAVASMVSIDRGVTGPAVTVSTACSSGAYAVGLAFDAIRRGETDVALTGGYDFAVTPGALHGFGALMVLSQHNDDPPAACRPFDRSRDGMVLGDGAAILVLESAAHARARGARVYARIAGWGATSEAASLVTPAGEGAGMAETMRLALAHAGLEPADIDWVNAHGTGTVVNDACESRAIRAVFGEGARRVAVSSQKSMLGHSLGASGAIEAATSALAISEQTIPPTANLEQVGADCELNHVAGVARRARVRGVISNSFAFGGHNCSIVLAGPPPA